MTKAELEKYLANPNVRKMLDLISYTEGTQGNGYRTAFGGGKLPSLADHPRYLKTFKQTDGKTNKTSAAGRYQFLRGTWDNLAKQYGFEDFGPRNQDLGAVALLKSRGALDPLLKGDFKTAIQRTGKEWASLPSSNYKQNKKSWDKVNKFLGGEIANPPVDSGDDGDYNAQIAPVPVPMMPVPTLPETSVLTDAPLVPAMPSVSDPFNMLQSAVETTAYNKPGQDIPIVQSPKGLAVPETEEEFDIFASVADANLGLDQEPAVVAVGEALANIKSKQNSKSLLDTNPLSSVVGDIFDAVEV